MNLNTLYLDVTIVMLIVAILLALALWKKRGYEKDVQGKIKAEIRLPSGRSMYYYKPCEEEAEVVEITHFTYFLNPRLKRWHKHPSSPFLGMKWLQSDIRTECWDLNNPNPVRAPKADGTPEDPYITASEIHAKIRQIQALHLVAEEEEMKAQQDRIVKTFENQPNKWVVYAGLGTAVIITIVTLVITAQIGGVL